MYLMGGRGVTPLSTHPGVGLGTIVGIIPRTGRGIVGRSHTATIERIQIKYNLKKYIMYNFIVTRTDLVLNN